MRRNPLVPDTKTQFKLNNSENLRKIESLLAASMSYNERGDYYMLLVELGWIKRYIKEIYGINERYVKQDGERK